MHLLCGEPDPAVLQAAAAAAATAAGATALSAADLDELADDYAGKAKVVKVDIDQNQATALKYHVRSIPMLLLFKGGQVQATQIGAVGKGQLAQMIDKAL